MYEDGEGFIAAEFVIFPLPEVLLAIIISTTALDVLWLPFRFHNNLFFGGLSL
jgi:hypothetical protein